MKHANIALFVPHAGCKHMCSFCNQRTISGQVKPLEPDDVRRTLAAVKPGTLDAQNTQLAFFGGSFTAIDREYMTALLDAASEYAGKGLFSGIRISTRPDAIDEGVLMLLKGYGVTAIELGAQSTDDEVLTLNQRGHTRGDIMKASALVRRYGFSLGLQMMTGLYGDTDSKALATCEDIISARADTVRIYPTIVLENTQLDRLYKQGAYKPQSVEHAVQLCAVLLKRFYEARIDVIRLGLHSGGGVEDGFVAGPYHPAFGELCESRVYYNAASEQLAGKQAGEYELLVPPGEISKMTGQKRQNLEKFSAIGYNCKVKADAAVERYTVRVQRLVGKR